LHDLLRKKLNTIPDKEAIGRVALWKLQVGSLFVQNAAKKVFQFIEKPMKI
jgi:hypothetical protein